MVIPSFTCSGEPTLYLVSCIMYRPITSSMKRRFKPQIGPVSRLAFSFFILRINKLRKTMLYVIYISANSMRRPNSVHKKKLREGMFTDRLLFFSGKKTSIKKVCRKDSQMLEEAKWFSTRIDGPRPGHNQRKKR